MIFETHRAEAEGVLARVEADLQIPDEHRGVAVARAHALAITAAILELQPERTLEVGLGWGYSAACIQAGGTGKHTIVSMDPDEARQRLGMTNAMLYGVPRIFLGPSDIALATLLEEGREAFDFILIDGGHKFDTAFVDFHYALQLCAVGGTIMLDDCWMPSIRTLCSWIATNYANVEVVEYYECLDMYRKLGPDERVWTHFAPFEVHPA